MHTTNHGGGSSPAHLAFLRRTGDLPTAGVFPETRTCHVCRSPLDLFAQDDDDMDIRGIRAMSAVD